MERKGSKMNTYDVYVKINGKWKDVGYYYAKTAKEAIDAAKEDNGYFGYEWDAVEVKKP